MTPRPAVLLAGATGLVGGLALKRWLAKADGPLLLAPVRRPLALTHPRLLALPGGWDETAIRTALESQGAQLQAYACCLGTTIRQAGSREAFLEVDRDLVLALGGIAHRLGARQALLVSSVGASAQSGNFYLRVKGEAERGLGALGFERVDCLRPGLLLGERGERRPAEALGQRLAPLANLLARGPLRRYRAIAADDVAAAMVGLCGRNGDGRHVHEYDAIKAVASG
ncbi:NAD-dependent dehydratase [uncultured Arenimonas sp.]|uniref:NAD-dependent dehydratase n=1 Tax=uncultured Arenimonas sp. TaxID=546226 RepID=UPI0030DC75FA